MDFAAAGLLDGLEGEERSARLELLERLAADGVELEELRDAVAEDRLVLLPVERALGGRYTAHEVAKRTELPPDLLLRMRRALGLPHVEADDSAWGEADLAAAQAVKRFRDAGIPEDAVIEITRVLGEGMSRLAPTITGAFAQTYLEPGDSERDVALRYAEMAEALLPSTSPVLEAALSAHVRESARRGIIGRAELQRGNLTAEDKAAVCFADLVGFTRLGGQIDPEELGTVARRFAELAGNVASGPIQLVKTIGDAAMFVSQDATALVAAALELVAAVERADLPAVRAGVACGPVLSRAGDFYGHTVNVASRVTGSARPGSVLCTQEVRDAAEADFAWSSAGRFRLKGVEDRQPLYRARPAPPAEKQPAEREDEPARKPTKGRRRKRASS